MSGSLSMKPFFASCVAGLAAASLFGAEPSAYAVNGATWAGPQMSYLVNAANLDLPGMPADTAVRSGADVWLQQSAAFRFNYAGSSSQTTNTYDGVNLVLFRNASSGSAIATTYWWTSGTRIVDADVVFWDAAFTFFRRLERLFRRLLHRRHRGPRIRPCARPRPFGVQSMRRCIPRRHPATPATGRWTPTTSRASARFIRCCLSRRQPGCASFRQTTEGRAFSCAGKFRRCRVRDRAACPAPPAPPPASAIRGAPGTSAMAPRRLP